MSPSLPCCLAPAAAISQLGTCPADTEGAVWSKSALHIQRMSPQMWFHVKPDANQGLFPSQDTKCYLENDSGETHGNSKQFAREGLLINHAEIKATIVHNVIWGR